MLGEMELWKTIYVIPWAVYTIPSSLIRDNLTSGILSVEAKHLVADVIDEMVRS
jgi:hypothetical protein